MYVSSSRKWKQIAAPNDDVVENENLSLKINFLLPLHLLRLKESFCQPTQPHPHGSVTFFCSF